MTTKSYTDVGAVQRTATGSPANKSATDVGAVQAQATTPGGSSAVKTISGQGGGYLIRGAPPVFGY